MSGIYPINSIVFVINRQAIDKIQAFVDQNFDILAIQAGSLDGLVAPVGPEHITEINDK